MAFVKKYLDTGCTEYILLDNKHTIVQPKQRCDMSNVPEDFQIQLDEITKNTDETIYINKRLIKNIAVGDEVNL